MKITRLSLQARNKNRVNVEVDGHYLFALDLFQVGALGIKVGREYSDEELKELRLQSLFGKLYTRSLEYITARPRSEREVRQYIARKLRSYGDKDRQETELSVTDAGRVTEMTMDRLMSKGYINDHAFADYWVRYRNQTKGTSMRRLQMELRQKGVSGTIIDETLAVSDRTDSDEIQKMLAKKARRYPDKNKMMQYLVRQGFSYDSVRAAVDEHYG